MDDIVRTGRTWRGTVLTGIAALMLGISAVGAPPAAAQAETLRTGGTGVALGGMRTLGDGFEETHPGVEVEVLPSLGSSGAIKTVLAGAVDVCCAR